ncbi:hypothetical protein [Caloranaerobacter ferrireducens]|uniref:hypothetical protein n=1 Tax=Caloranaerobacter ferrireducens TaxID=1323370 RepID=UPI00084D29ED|nr:hypothetical protein [Caloranaerobacter ferrireducens]
MNNKQNYIVEKILQKLSEQGFAQGKRNKFELVESTEKGVRILREKGTEDEIKKDEIEEVVKILLEKPNIYDYNVENFRKEIEKVIKRRIYSPLWAMIHLVDKDEYILD